MRARIGDVVAALEAAYPPSLAQDWDAVGLVCGDLHEPVRRVLVAVDPVPETVQEALDDGAQLLVTHHPLLLRGVHGVPADEPKGALVHRLIRAGVALFTAHTNADAADPGVSDALAAALGLDVTGPLVPDPAAGSLATTGLGRIGVLPAPESFGAFVDRVQRALPATAWGVRAAGDPSRTVTPGGGLRWRRRLGAGGRDGRGRGRLRHRRPAPPPGFGAFAGRRTGAGRRRALGLGAAVVQPGCRRRAGSARE